MESNSDNGQEMREGSGEEIKEKGEGGVIWYKATITHKHTTAQLYKIL